MKEGYPEQWLGGMSKGEGVAAEIRLLIVSGEIEVDTLLTENQVAKQFDVSRSLLEMHSNYYRRINLFN